MFARLNRDACPLPPECGQDLALQRPDVLPASRRDRATDGPIIRAPFFKRDPVICARELIGTSLHWGRCAGVVVETEAYLAQNDEACHTFLRPSARAFVERNGFVLIRALEPRQGITLMKRRRGVEELRRLCSGPGKLTQALDITDRHHQMDLCADPRRCFVHESGEPVEVVTDKRIGITRSPHFPWRFTLRGSPFVSVPAKP